MTGKEDDAGVASTGAWARRPWHVKKELVMAVVIAKPCVGVKDTACVTVCPVDCIHPTNEEAGFDAVEQLFIQADQCICCKLCVEECPVKAIFDEGDLPEEWMEYLERNEAYFQGK